MKEEKHLEIHGGLREDIGMKTCLHGPMNYAKQLELRFRVGDLDLPERRDIPVVERRTWLPNMCPCCTTIQSRTHIVRGCEIYKEEPDALEMRKLCGCDTEEFGRLESSEKTIAILGDRWWPPTAKQDGGRISKQLLCSIW